MTAYSLGPALAHALLAALATCSLLTAPLATAGAKERATLRGHIGSVVSVAFSPDGKTLASGGGDGSIKLWDVASGKLRATLTGHKERRTIWVLAFSADGKALASAGDFNSIRVWDVRTGRNTATLSEPFGFLVQLAFGSDGKTIVFAWLGCIRQWDPATNKTSILLDLRSEMDLATPYLWSAGGKLLAGSRKLLAVPKKPLKGSKLPAPSSQLTVWDVTARKKLAGVPFFMIFSPDGKTVASYTGYDFERAAAKVHIWDFPAGTLKATGSVPSQITCLAFSPNGKALAVGFKDKDRGMREGNIRLFEAATGQEIGTVKRHGGPLFALAFSPDGKTLASASCDGTVKLFDVSAITKLAK
jgi:WD40 repeat protein